MPLEIKEHLRKYVELSEDGESVKAYVCPVEGCDPKFRNPSPGSVRMHMILSKDEAHKLYEPKLTLDDVRELAGLPRVR